MSVCESDELDLQISTADGDDDAVWLNVDVKMIINDDDLDDDDEHHLQHMRKLANREAQQGVAKSYN